MVLDHANEKITRRSITGFMIMLGRTPILSTTKRKGEIETSTYGAELCDMKTFVEAVQSVRYILKSLEGKVK